MDSMELDYDEFSKKRWPDVSCESSPQYFELNKNIGVVPESSQITYDARVSSNTAQHQS